MKQRIITGILAGVPFLAFLYFGGYWYATLLFVLACIGYDEFMRMCGIAKNMPLRIIGLAGIFVLVDPWQLQWIADNLPVQAIIWVIMLLFFVLTVTTKNKVTVDQVALLFLAVVYIGYGFHYMIATRMPEQGLFWTCLVFICIWITDSGAYFTGRAIGKTPLWPAISPKKTVEGALGGIVLSVIAAILFALAKPELLSVGRAVSLGIVIAIVGQMGDLIQSAYKRVKGIKDTGNLLPGHGGVLDRVDSWLIVFPFVNLLSVLPSM